MSRPDKYPAVSYNQVFGLIFGGVYLAIGAAGFVSTKGVDFAGTSGGALMELFSVNPLHNVAHLAIGAALLGAAVVGPGLSRSVNAVIGVAYLALGVVGFFLVDTSANVLALNFADNLLHIGTGAVALAIATVAAKSEPAPVG